MSARDDHQVLAAVEGLVSARGLNGLARAITSILDECDDLRTRTGAQKVIDRHHERARTAEADADRMARTLRELRTPHTVTISNVLDLHLVAVKARLG